MAFIDLSTEHTFLKEGGEMGVLTRAYDWSLSPIGPVATWPAALRTTVGILLHSDFPMFLWWGDDMIQFYNDAYRPSLGQNGKHPRALGQEANECWPEIWDVIYPLIQQVKKTGKSFFAEDQLIPIYRNGGLEDVYWTFSYSAVIGETGSIDGVLVVCNETTKKIQALEEISRTQNKLALSENNLKNIILQAPVAMGILKGPDHVVEIANERMFELWGRSPETLNGKPIFDILIDAKREGFSDLLDQVYKTGETYRANAAAVTLPRNEGTGLFYVNFVYEAWRNSSGSIAGVMVVAIDVSEEVTARKKFEESENRVRAIVQSAPFPIGVYVGREMRIAFANQSIIDVWGKGNEVVGKTYHEVLPELHDQDIYQQLDTVFTTGIPFHARTQRVDIVMDGKLQPYYFNYSFTPLYDTTGNVYGVMNTAAELTDIMVAKQKVEQSELNFRNMVKQAPVAMCILLGPDHIVEVANNLIIELWGKSEEEVLGKPIFVGLPDAKDQGLEKLLDDVYQTGIAFHASEHPVMLLRRGKYETIYQNFVYEPYRDSDGTILGVLAITIDVTEQVTARLKIEEVVRERTESLRQSNSELSQFAYITSHDLQEPARKISTFSDMLRNSLGEQLDQRSKSYLQKIESSASRMLTLIRDVLAISQLSKTNVEYKQVNLNNVLEEVKSDFELLMEQKNCTIESDHLPVVEAVPVQMSQLFSNLVSNALKFMKPGAKICLTIRAGVLGKKEEKLMPNHDPSKQYYKLEFIDSGIGFNQANADQIFDIFQRLHSKEEYQGTGIGLAMCRKIAENHGGNIFATSSPGKGSTFTVILPVKQ